MATAAVDPQRELDAFLRTDFQAFVEKVFEQLNPGRPLIPNWHHRAITYYITRVAIERQHTRLIINLPPRAMKSIIASVALPAFLLGLDPRLRVVVACYSQELSNGFARQTRAIMQSDWYRRVFPSTRLGRTVEHDFHTTSGGFRFATSTQGTFTGRGGDVIIVDDPIKADEVWSDTRRNAALEWTRSTLFSRLDDKRFGVTIVVQQRLHEDDVSGYLERGGGWLKLSLPAIADQDEAIAIGPGLLHMRRHGDVLEPIREPMGVLDQLRRDLGSANFSAQYLQMPTPADGDIVRLSWFKRYELIPPGGMIVLSLDTASKVAEHNDYSAYTLWTIVDGRYFLMHAWRGHADYPTLKRKIMDVATTIAPDKVLIEDKVTGSGLIQDLAAEAAGIPVVGYTPDVDKESRLRRHAARIEAGLVSLPDQGSDWLSAFEHEVRMFPGGKHDDQVDSMSQMLDHFAPKPKADLILTFYRS